MECGNYSMGVTPATPATQPLRGQPLRGPAWTLAQYHHVAQHLRAIRQSCGINQPEFARQLQIRQSHIPRWELYGTLPSIKTLERIAAILDGAGYVPPPELKGWTIAQAMQAVSTLPTNSATYVALRVNEGTIRNWRRGTLPQLDLLLRVEAYIAQQRRERAS